MSRRHHMSWQLGVAMIGGVPALVLVSMSQIATLAGGAAILVWILSAILGLIMAFTFADLARCYPGISGGIGILGGYAFEETRPWAAILSRWSYWLGWSPALAVYSTVIGNYAALLLTEHPSPWIAATLSITCVVASTLLNYRGLGGSTVVQAVLGVAMFALLLFFTGAPLLSGRFQWERLLPLVPPTGWGTWEGLTAVAGALFLAGWTCYGAELAISMAAEFHGGTRDVVVCLIVVALVTFGVYTIVPTLITGSLGVTRIQSDPAEALLHLVPAAAAAAGRVLVFAAIFISMLLSVNMIATTSSRLLFQIAHDEHSFSFLGRINRYGIPGNAMLFDMLMNVALILAVFAFSRGRTATVPLALLCASNVGYFVTIVLALIGAAMAPRTPGRVRRLCCSPAVVGPLVTINLVLLACAGFAWGWPNVVTGWIVLVTLTLITVALRRFTAKAVALEASVTEEG
jgi:amino acid transporter